MLPTNKSPICVRVLKDEKPVTIEAQNPHSPMNIVNESILPPHFKKYKAV
jgi:hypothetical protein